MKFTTMIDGVLEGIQNWEPKLTQLPEATITNKRNEQDRTIKQIVGHMVDSASNNIHRIVHLQYDKSPLTFPNYATNGNNDRWIQIQNYQEKNWTDLIQLWKYSNLHWVDVVKNVNPKMLENEWDSKSEYGNVSLEDMINDYLQHFNLHLRQIEELINKK